MVVPDGKAGEQINRLSRFAEGIKVRIVVLQSMARGEKSADGLGKASGAIGQRWGLETGARGAGDGLLEHCGLDGGLLHFFTAKVARQKTRLWHENSGVAAVVGSTGVGAF
jgi:hypothetical protein